MSKLLAVHANVGLHVLKVIVKLLQCFALINICLYKTFFVLCMIK